MFAVFLPPINFRGNRSPYLWWFYKFASAFGNDAAYICGDEYFIDPKVHYDNGRVEVGEALARRWGYQVPDAESLSRLSRINIPLHVWKKVESQFPSNPVEAFRYFCLQEDELLYESYVRAIDELEHQAPIEAGITCINCATLQRVFRERNLPLIHFELGPLRDPTYLNTAYFDFSGVNGNTEARKRFEATNCELIEDEDLDNIETLRNLFLTEQNEVVTPLVADLGIGLQVEDDSNIICYSNGISAVSMISRARYLLAEEKINSPVLVRAHPGSYFSLRNLPPGFAIDKSDSSIEFIHACKKLQVINSSLAVEALLQSKEVEVLGECSFSFCAEEVHKNGNVLALSFYLLNYLVPWNLAFSSDYIKWRLSRPSEKDIRNAHLRFFMDEKIKVLESQIRELEAALGNRENEIAAIKSSIVWRLSCRLWKIYRVVRKVFGKS